MMNEQIKMGSGKFTISVHAIRDNPLNVMRVMSKVIVYEVFNGFASNIIVYYAQSPLFDYFDNYHAIDVPEYYFAVNNDCEVLIQNTPFEYLHQNDLIPAKCEITGRTDNLFAYSFDSERKHPLYRVLDPIDEEDRGKKYHDIFTGIEVIIGGINNEQKN